MSKMESEEVTVPVEIRQLWILWASMFFNVIVVGAVLYFLRTYQGKGSLDFPGSFQKPLSIGALVMILLFWWIGWTILRRFIGSLATTTDSSSSEPNRMNRKAVSKILPGWAFFEGGALVAMVYAFLTGNLAGTIPGLVLHIGTLAYYNPSTIFQWDDISGPS